MTFMERAAAGSLPLWDAAANTRFLPLVDKGIHGFHGPCPHRTSLRALDIGAAMPAGPRLVLLGARIVKTLRPERSLLWFSSRRRSDGLAELIRATATLKWAKAGPFRRIAPCLLRVKKMGENTQDRGEFLDYIVQDSIYLRDYL